MRCRWRSAAHSCALYSKWHLGIFLKLETNILIKTSCPHILSLTHTEQLVNTHTIPSFTQRTIWQNLSPWPVPSVPPPPPPLPSSSAGHGDSRPVGGSAMCHTLHGSAGEEDWHRACVTLAQFDVLCPRTGTTVGGIAMCHNHHHPLLCRISPHMCVPVCVCVCFCIAIL